MTEEQQRLAAEAEAAIAGAVSNETTRQEQQEATAEAAAKDALAAVIGDDPQNARDILAGMSFRGRALLIAWANELRRLGVQEQTDYESRERAASRIALRPLTADERATFATVVQRHLNACVTDGREWTDLRDLVIAVAPYTGVGTETIRDWARGHIGDLVRGGTLSPTTEGTGPAEYRIISVPGQDESGTV